MSEKTNAFNDIIRALSAQDNENQECNLAHLSQILIKKEKEKGKIKCLSVLYDC